MILGALNPMENMPGIRATTGMEDEYRKHVQCKTVLYAMLFWLESRTSRSSAWKDISATYFKCKGKDILAMVKNWAIKNPLLRAYDKDGG